MIMEKIIYTLNVREGAVIKLIAVFIAGFLCGITFLAAFAAGAAEDENAERQYRAAKNRGKL